jgi:hypothetical protein
MFFLHWEMFYYKRCRETKTHILCSVTFFRKSHHLWKMSKNLVEPEGPQMTSQDGGYVLHAG